MSIIPGFGGGGFTPAPLPPPPPPPPERTDPEVVQAKEDLKQSVARRRGRAKAILTGNIPAGGSILNPSATGGDEPTMLG
jgi:hypothetical protein